jgi:NAD(P)-dependent dehydrogenase (short-subunit alcohol dehydrogenase family)
LAADIGDGALAIRADVTDRDTVIAAAHPVRHELGRADILVTNAEEMPLAAS